jgi:hypothetical protein
MWAIVRPVWAIDRPVWAIVCPVWAIVRPVWAIVRPVWAIVCPVWPSAVINISPTCFGFQVPSSGGYSFLIYKLLHVVYKV